MNAKKYFEKHYAKLNLEAVVHSSVWGLVSGAICGFIAALITWFTALKPAWLCILISVGALLLVGTATAVILYFVKYRPTPKSSAKRLDGLGMRERMITMLELKDDDSLIAKIQREDAKEKLSSIPTSRIKIALSTTMIVLMSVFGILSVGMTTVSALAAAGVIQSGNEVLDDTIEEIEPEVYFSVTYEAEDGGYIDGEADQLVLEGGNAEPVTAVAEEGYVFVEWDDGLSRPGRQDNKITDHVVYVAIFELIMEEDEGEGDNEDQPTDSPKESEDAEQQRPSDDPQDSSGSAGGKYEEVNQIIDGNKYYREYLEFYQELMRERLETEGDSLSEEERAIIEGYLGIV